MRYEVSNFRDQLLLEENTDVKNVISEKNPVWMEPQNNYKIKLSVETLRTSNMAFELIKQVLSKKKNKINVPKNIADAIPDEFLTQTNKVIDFVNLDEIYNAFSASGSHLFLFIMNYNYRKKVTDNEKLLYFCQIASQYSNELEFTDEYNSTEDVVYPIIYNKIA